MSLMMWVEQAIPWWLAFFAVAARVGFVFAFMPIWGDGMLPPRSLVLMVLAVAAVLTPTAPVNMDAYPATLAETIVWLASEAAFGFSVALVVRLAFAAVLIGGQIAGEEIGFAIANILSPDQSSQITVVTQFKYMLAILLFFAFNFHLLLLRAVADSFAVAPLFALAPGGLSVAWWNEMAQGMFTMGVKLAAPLLGTMIFVNVALGLINKAAPQVNVFIESFPVRIAAGLFMLAGVMMALARLIETHLGQTMQAVTGLIRLWG